LYISPIIAVLLGFFSGFKKFWLGLIIPVITCPLIFTVIFEILSFVHYQGLPNIDPNSGDFNTVKASQVFYQYSFSMMLTGFVIGGICGFVLFCFSKERKLD